MSTEAAPIRHRAYLNVDLGEAYGNYVCGPDEELLPMIDHANVACGFHAGSVVLAGTAYVTDYRQRSVDNDGDDSELQTAQY